MLGFLNRYRLCMRSNEFLLTVSGENFMSFDEAVTILRQELNYPEDRALHFVKRFDHNKDGRLSTAEFGQFKSKISETYALRSIDSCITTQIPPHPHPSPIPIPTRSRKDHPISAPEKQFFSSLPVRSSVAHIRRKIWGLRVSQVSHQWRLTTASGCHPFYGSVIFLNNPGS